MSALLSSRPDPAEYHEYFGRYVGLVPEGDVLSTLEAEMETTQALLATVPPRREEYSYARGKWNLREVVGHLVDSEQVFLFRSLWIARGAEGALPSMEQDAWAAASNAGRRPLAGIAHEWSLVRASAVAMFRGFGDDAWMRVGVAGNRPFTARAFPWIIAGHELYHRALLRRDYGLGVDA